MASKDWIQSRSGHKVSIRAPAASAFVLSKNLSETGGRGSYGVVYALCDPDTRERRYIGQTVKVPRYRFSEHLKEAGRGVVTHKANWIRSLLPAEPLFEIVEECEDAEHLNAAEIFQIAWARTAGARLTNLWPGGRGGPAGIPLKPGHRARIGLANRGRPVSEATRQLLRAKMAGKKPAPDVCAKAADAARGNQYALGYRHTPGTRAFISALHLGRKKSPETRARMSAAAKGKPKSAEHRAALSAALTGKPGHPHTPESRAKIGSANRGKVVSDATRQKLRAWNLGKKVRKVEK